jgi:alkylation response protein AidB-like acyl-CoA dehydrogenase
MDFALTAEQLALRDDTIAFAQAKLGSNVAADDLAERLPREDWLACAEFGVQGWPVPAEYGGKGFDPLTTMIGLEALGYGCRDNGLVFAVNNHLWGCAIYLIEHGTPEQKHRYLPAMCRGQLIGAQALSEPEAGSDILNLTTTATRDGDAYVLRGTKWFISNGPVAGIFVAFARTGESGPGQGQLSAFIVTTDMPGVRTARQFSKMGVRTAPMGAVEFDEVRVPAANLLGREGAGYSIFSSTIEWERAFIFASHVGTMARLLDASVDHARSRVQFGRPIGTFQAVAHPIADMKIRLELARLALYQVGWLKREGQIALLESTVAKIFISESLVQTAMAAMQVHGARGYVTDSGIERELRDALASPIYAGTSDIQRGILAELLGLHGSLSGKIGS